MVDIIIVGAGTAGLSSAIYAVRSGKTALVFEGKNYGGQIINTPEIENYPGIKNISGFEFATNLYEQAKSLGAKIQFEKVTNIVDNGNTKTVITTEKSYECKAVIVATGAINRPLGLENESELIGMGISYCATCDGAFFRGKNVAVVGGGNTALEDASFLSNYCENVYLIHRRFEFRGEETLVKSLQEKANVHFVLNSKVIELKAKFNLSSIMILNVETQKQEELFVEGLFVAIGQMPENGNFSKLINLDDNGYIVANETCKTNVKGVFTAGDCRTKKVRQLATAAADGAIAGIMACEYLQNL